MLDVHIETQLTTMESAKKLGESLRDYFAIEDVQFDICEGTHIKQQLSLKADSLHLELETDELVSFLRVLNVDILLKVIIVHERNAI